jgi:hypothetical protein
MVAAWMSGYFNASVNRPVVSLERFEYNKHVVIVGSTGAITCRLSILRVTI